MTRLTKSYLSVLMFLGVGLAGVLADGFVAEMSAPDQISTSLAGFPGPSLSVPYYESRWPLMDNHFRPLFPGMRPLSTMDFIYAQ